MMRMRRHGGDELGGAVGGGDELAGLDEALVDGGDGGPEGVEGGGDDEAGGAEGGELGGGGLRGGEGGGAGAAVAEVDGDAAVGAGAEDPGDDGLGDGAGAEGGGDLELAGAAGLADDDDDADLGDGLEAEDVREHGAAEEAVRADDDALAEAVRVLREEVAELVEHARRAAHGADRARPVELAHDDVLGRAARVADLERARREPADGAGADEHLAVALGGRDEALDVALGDALARDHDRADRLRVQRDQRRREHRALLRVVDQHVRLRERRHRLRERREDRDLHLARPVLRQLVRRLAVGLDDRRHRRHRPLAQVVKVQHPLQRVRRHQVHQRPRLPAEQRPRPRLLLLFPHSRLHSRFHRSLRLYLFISYLFFSCYFFFFSFCFFFILIIFL